MTLIAFPPERLDELSLRLFDLAAEVRRMAMSSREIGLDDFQLHGNKAQEWLGQLEGWVHDAAARLDTAAIKRRGALRARQFASEAPPAGSRRRSGRKKSR